LKQTLGLSELRAARAEKKECEMTAARDFAIDEVATMRESVAKVTKYANDCREYVGTMQVRAQEMSDKYDEMRNSYTAQLQAGVREGVKAALDQILQSASESILEKVTAAAATSSGAQFEPNEPSPASSVAFSVGRPRGHLFGLRVGVIRC